MAKNETFAKIIEWLYIHDNMFQNKNEWREKFVKMLKDLLCDDDENYMRNFLLTGVDTKCNCTNATGGYCPIHNSNNKL